MIGLFNVFAQEKKEEIVVVPTTYASQVLDLAKYAGDKTLAGTASARDAVLNSVPTCLKTFAGKINNITGSAIFDEVAIGNINWVGSIGLGGFAGYFLTDSVKNLIANQKLLALKNAAYSAGLGFGACLLTNSPAGLVLVAKSVAGGVAVNLVKTTYRAYMGKRYFKVSIILVDPDAKPAAKDIPPVKIAAPALINTATPTKSKTPAKPAAKSATVVKGQAASATKPATTGNGQAASATKPATPANGQAAASASATKPASPKTVKPASPKAIPTATAGC